jgi:NAD(P)-dependent dehydrogenase (short-subunit alcohol dehydrogenase family)
MNASTRKTALITGASSGIGRASMLQMARAGWQVFAAVRKIEDGEKLQAENPASVTPVIMDVTDRSSVFAAADQVSSQLDGRGLDGLANIAGVGISGPLEYVSSGDLQQIFDINVFGQITATQAFLPAIRRSRGRIVNITSVGAHIAIPFGGLLNASKGAFGLLSDTLRLELRPFGIHVCTVEPGAIKTPAVDKTLGNVEAEIAKLPAQGAAEYGDMFRRFTRRAYAREMNGSSPEVVAKAVHHALTARRPRVRYRVGKHAHVLSALPEILPDSLLDRFRLKMLGLPTSFGAIKAV